MQLYRDDGIVLRTQKLGEADRIITILTRDNGRVRLVAKGVRRTTSKFGARLEPFAHVDFQVFSKHNRALDLIKRFLIDQDHDTHTPSRLVFITVNLVTDLTYVFLDPRLRRATR